MAEALAAIADPHSALRPLNVLVVDDSDLSRLAISLMLKSWSARVHTAATGAEVITFSRTTPLDLVILDYLLPDIEGFALARTLKSKLTVPPVVIATSGLAELPLAPGTAGNPIDGFIAKPIRAAELDAAIRFAQLRRDGYPAFLEGKLAG